MLIQVQSRLISLLVALLSQLPIHRKHAPVAPPAPAVTFRVLTDSVPQAQIAGVILPASDEPKGTVFLLHGYGRSKEDLYGWNWIRRDLGWNLVAFDFREHGQSTNSYHVCTLGYQEIWDVKAVIDEAEKRGLAKPYIIYGRSMGASVGLRWATRDSRVSGVLAVSPYRNALQAVQVFSRERMHLRQTLVAPQSGLGKMLDTVDLPTDVKKRRDLRIWILCGEQDYFRAADQRAILGASPSPASLKRLFVIPGGSHNNLWRWRGDANVPGHDQIVKDFLASCRRA